jgi:hypothetical protein
MHEAGTPMEGILLALEAVEARDNAAAEKRAKAAARKQAQRDRERDSHATVTGQDGDSPVFTPSLDKEIPPKPPKENNPIPVCDTLTRKAAGFGPPEQVERPLWNEFCAQRKKPLSRTAFSRIQTTLNEAAEVGWPPGEIVARSIASGWETVFIPKEPRNGNRTANDRYNRPNRSSEIDVAAGNLGFS